MIQLFLDFPTKSNSPDQVLTTQVAHLRMVFTGMFSTTFQDDDGEDEVLLHDPAVPEFSDEDYIRCIAARLAGQSNEEYRRIANKALLENSSFEACYQELRTKDLTGVAVILQVPVSGKEIRVGEDVAHHQTI